MGDPLGFWNYTPLLYSTPIPRFGCLKLALIKGPRVKKLRFSDLIKEEIYKMVVSRMSDFSDDKENNALGENVKKCGPPCLQSYQISARNIACVQCLKTDYVSL